ncbi:unnamed protein product [Caenorhabditis nigoni]
MLTLIFVRHVYKKNCTQFSLEDQKTRTQETPSTSILRYCLNNKLYFIISKWLSRLKFAGACVSTTQKELTRFLENYQLSIGSAPTTMIKRDDRIGNHWKNLPSWWIVSFMEIWSKFWMIQAVCGKNEENCLRQARYKHLERDETTSKRRMKSNVVKKPMGKFGTSYGLLRRG